jgi:hypothetical protein
MSGFELSFLVKATITYSLKSNHPAPAVELPADKKLDNAGCEESG